MWTVVWSSRPALSAIWRKMPLAPRVVRRPPRLLSRLCAHCEAVLKFVRILLEAFRFAPVDTTVAPAVVQCRATGPGGPFRMHGVSPLAGVARPWRRQRRRRAHRVADRFRLG